jgi:hypothetical protein
MPERLPRFAPLESSHIVHSNTTRCELLGRVKAQFPKSELLSAAAIQAQSRRQ